MDQRAEQHDRGDSRNEHRARHLATRAHEWPQWRIQTVIPTVVLKAITSATTSGAPSRRSSTLAPAAADPTVQRSENHHPTTIASSISPRCRGRSDE